MSEDKDYKLSYRIIESYPDERLFVVRYLCDFMDEHELKSDPNVDEHGVPVRCRTDISLEIPLEYGQSISDEELDAMIWSNCPRHFFDKMYMQKTTPDKVKLSIPVGKKKELPVSQIDKELETLGQKKAKDEALKSLDLSEEEWDLLIGKN